MRKYLARFPETPSVSVFKFVNKIKVGVKIYIRFNNWSANINWSANTLSDTKVELKETKNSIETFYGYLP